MASVDVEIASRRYTIACRDGEEDQVRAVAAIVDKRARDATGALGSLPEGRQLLFTALLLADDIKELQENGRAAHAPAPAEGPAPPPPPPEPVFDPAVAEALERLATRLELLAVRLEQGA